ncbi:MAG: glycosyltransferase, partial [Lachnospiraceae bacterium]|nr:glycosyltransferase [Lachnospiraceae bacterium]
MENIKLSVIFITYNHEKYVEKALRSVCEQETDFAYEVVVGEDCSTDSTREILKRVAAEYPDKVRLLFREKNFGRPTLNVYNTTMECRGEYLAYLEGDDYWTDKFKLKKQVDFLEEHPEYIACTHDCVMIDENGDEITDEAVLKVGDMYKWSGKFTYDDYKHSEKWPG